MAQDELARKVTKRARLRFVVFEVTPECNLRCRHCYNIWKMPGYRGCTPSTYRQADKTLRRLLKMVKVDAVTMSGGEPVLSERFAELVLGHRLGHLLQHHRN